MAQTELGVRTSAVTRLASGMEKLMDEFQQELRNPLGAEPTVPASPSASAAASDAHTPDAFKREALGAAKLLERAQVQVEAAMHLAAGVALSVEAEEQERLLDLPLDEKIGRNKGRRGSGRGKHQDAFTVTPPTNANINAGTGPLAAANPTGTDSSSTANSSTGADSSSTSAGPASGTATGFPRGSAFIPGFSSHDVADSEVEFPKVWCGVSVKAMDEALWGLGSELALLWGRSEFVTTGMLLDTATLSRLPKLEARFITGMLNSRLVKTAVKHCVGLTDEQAASYDARLHEFIFPVKYDVTGQYPVRSANDVAKFAEVTRNRLHAEPLAVRARREMKHRYVAISNESNGMCSISGLLPATAAHRFMNTLTDFAITAKTQHDTRTLKQLIADVFTDLITHNYNQSYPNTPPNPTGTSGAGPDASPSTGSTGGTERTSGPGTDSGSASGTDSGPAAGTGSWQPRDQEPADAGPGGSAPTERLSYDSIHDLFNHTTTPETGFQGTSAPDSGNGSAPSNDWVREDCYSVDPDGVIHERGDETESTVPVMDTEIGTDGTVGLRSGLRGEAKIFVTIPATSLAGLDEQDGMLSGYGPITADAIRELAGTAHTLYRMFVDPDTCRPLALGRSSYRVDTQLREFLQLRSDTCQFPGCGVNARRTDADHITEWETGGETNPENLQLLCRKHHNLKTHHGWQAKVIDPETNTIQWTSPLGNTYITEPSGIYTSETGACPDAHHRSDSSDAGTGAGNGARTDTGSSRDPWGMTPEENATTDFSDAPF
ncbi:HNH endonuclease signature motif containing protein [Haematomicrobium sanguinis]|uniref:HNH endonuclease signature motif containing protein n=1 Tax=Haematomicrobium sanguinis TaxID=479106 RepID=UPI0005508132|nr:HNH endonuclease signature motif containing protein [Haematomicrobium sanguinis]